MLESIENQVSVEANMKDTPGGEAEDEEDFANGYPEFQKHRGRGSGVGGWQRGQIRACAELYGH